MPDDQRDRRPEARRRVQSHREIVERAAKSFLIVATIGYGNALV
jgi:hypothetical protein